MNAEPDSVEPADAGPAAVKASSGGSGWGGRAVILTIVIVAIALGCFAWWYRYTNGRRSLQFWGGDLAWKVRHHKDVEAWRLRPVEKSGGVLPIIEHEGQLYEVAANRNISGAAGWLNARHALVEDGSYDWSASADSCEPEWRYALVIPGEKKQVIFLDLNCGAVSVHRRDGMIHMTPRIRDGIRRLAARTFASETGQPLEPAEDKSAGDPASLAPGE